MGQKGNKPPVFQFTISKIPIRLTQGSSTFYLIFVLGIGLGYLAAWLAQPHLFMSDTPDRRIYVCFSPGGNCEQLILNAILEATQRIHIQAYTFTSKPLAQALIQASQRGVHIRILCDKGQFSNPHSVVHRLKTHGIEVVPDLVKGLAHNKILLIDGNRLVLGSYNFTQAADTSNSENLLYIQDAQLHEIYQENWKKRYEASKEKMTRKGF